MTHADDYDNRLNALPEGVRNLLLRVLAVGKPYYTSGLGLIIDEALTRSAQINQNWVDVFDDIIAKYEAADPSTLTAEDADGRAEHIAGIRADREKAEAARQADLLGLELLKKLG